MKGSIITGGLLGIALGAVAVFALASGLPDRVAGSDSPGVKTGHWRPAMVEDAEASAGPKEFRPLRPGSDTITSPRRS
jgi:hypothetical protein